MVRVKEEVPPPDSDDVIVTFVEHGFPKRIKQEAQSSSTITHPMKLMSTDTGDQKYQRRVQILAEVHRPHETTCNQSILDHDYVPQKVVEVRSEASTSGGKTRQQEVQRIKQENPNPELNVFIPPPAGGITKSTQSMVYRHRSHMPGKQTVMVQQTPSTTSEVGTPVPAEHQVGDRYYCDKCNKSFKDLNYFR